MPEPRPLIFQLYTTYQRAGRLVARALEGTGIRPEDAALYSVLDRHGPLTPSALADQLGVGPSTLTYRLKALEAADVLVRRPNPDDGRSSLVELSPDGRSRWRVTIPAFARPFGGPSGASSFPKPRSPLRSRQWPARSTPSSKQASRSPAGPARSLSPD